MAGKTANVLARVKPEVKEEAEMIMGQLGIPASVVINMLYKQIIYTKSIPFSLNLPKEPMARDAMREGQFDDMMERGLEEAKSGKARFASDVFSEIRQVI
ncbi:MAG: type II toxin-antitoxin system RelB/DinJ family antitoxin [Clostridium sp.]|nr:type II toxin-antitoxin system RelB/DinJ family antitoxin [Clostridium sp.]